MKKVFAIISLILLNIPAWAEELPGAKSFWDDPINHPMTPLYALLGFMAVVVFLISLVAMSLIRVLNTLSKRAAEERAERLGVAVKPQVSFWTTLWTRWNAAVPVVEEKNIELDHNYDGIKELDNHLPPWWKWLFYGTVAWAAVYLVIYHYSDSLPLSEEEFRNEVAQAEEEKKQRVAAQPKVEIDESTLSYVEDHAILEKGKSVFTINCSPCHKNDGGGGIGPNLTDDYWLHGGEVKNVYGIIKNGVPEKGMIAWGSVLSPEQIRDVSFFIISMRGTNPPGAKAPQGQLSQVQMEQMRQDTTKVRASL